ncbi:AI-2E family transporter [Patescibacteria group bacterium]|nr:AI-2E family transporter [Patescibacteria group bacterium]
MLIKKTSFLEISYQTFLRFFLVLAGFIALFVIRDVILAVLFAVVIASAIEPFIEWGKQYKFPRLLSVVIVYALALAAIIGVIFLVVPLILNDLQGFLQSYATYQQKFLKEIEQLSGIPVATLFSGGIADLFIAGASRLVGFSSNVLGVSAFVFGGAASAIIILVVSFYLATQERGIENFLRLVSPLEDENYIIDLWQRSQKKMGQWLQAQILLALFVGVLVYLALTIVGVEYSLILGLLAAAFEIVPVIGPVLAAAPATFLAFLQSPILALYVIVIFFFIQQTESHLIVPVVMRRAVGLNPLIVVVALLVGAELGGIVGLLLAVPLASVAVEWLVDLDKKKRGLFQAHGS